MGSRHCRKKSLGMLKHCNLWKNATRQVPWVQPHTLVNQHIQMPFPSLTLLEQVPSPRVHSDQHISLRLQLQNCCLLCFYSQSSCGTMWWLSFWLMEPWPAMACRKNIPTIPFMKSLCTERWWCSCSAFVNFPGSCFNGRVELCTGKILDKSIGQEQIRALCHHLWLKLPWSILKLQSGSHTNIQNYSGEKRRKSRAEQTPSCHDFRAFSITAEFCSSQLLLELSPILTELVRKEKTSCLKITPPPTWVSGEQAEWESSTEQVKRKVASLKHTGASNTLHSAKFHCCASHYSAYWRDPASPTLGMLP